MKHLILYILLSSPFLSTAQKTVKVEKIYHEQSPILAIAILDSGKITHYYAGCSFKDITLLPDTTKIRLLRELFAFVNDTTVCFGKVYNLSNVYVGGLIPNTRTFTVRINALILMNYIAFSSKAFSYSPYPLFIDRATKKEITDPNLAINPIVDSYRKWFELIQQNGFANYSLPLAEGRYQWFGTSLGSQIFRIYPQWNDRYNCKELN